MPPTSPPLSTDAIVARRVSEAVAAHRRGWLLTPLRGKRPYLVKWNERPAPSEDEVIRWAEEGNVGVRTGPDSGVIVVDEDRTKGGAIEQVFGRVPWTVTALTGGGGRHFYFEIPAPCPGNSSGQLAPAIDTRGTGGQVVLPGSVHPDTGAVYSWADELGPDDAILSPLPDDVLEQLRKQPHEPDFQRPPHAIQRVTTSRWAQAAYERECDQVAEAPTGTRNETLNRAAFNLGQLVGGDELARDAVEAGLYGAAEACGLVSDDGQGQVEATIQSGLTSGIAKPRRNTSQVPRTIREPVQRPAAPTAAPAAPTTTATDVEPPPDAPMEILIPGAHRDADGQYFEIGNHDFANAVLDAMPEGLIYRKDRIPGIVTGDPGRRRFEHLTRERVRLMVDEHLRLVRWQKRQSDPEPRKLYVNCSRDHASHVHERACDHPRVREIRLMVNYPVFMGDALRVSEPGWNYGHCVYYDEPPELEQLETDVSLAECSARLRDLVIDFPFKAEADRDNFFGLLLTPFLRPALRGNTPMHLVLSSLERTGKSKLAEQVLGTIVTGAPIEAKQLAGTEEERNKTLLSVLFAGDTVAHFDNVRQYLDSAALASLLTASTYSGRLLGQTRMLKIPNYLTVVASGNNVRATAEIVKRTVPITLQPASDAPEERTDFEHPDLPAYVLGVRPRVIGALLSMVLRWRDGERIQPDVSAKGGFEEWTRVIGGVLATNEFQDWRTNERAWSRSADPEGEDLRTFVEAWAERWPTGEMVRSSDLLELAESASVFTYHLRSNSLRGRQTAFANLIRKHLDAPVREWFIRGRGHGNNTLYFLESNE